MNVTIQQLSAIIIGANAVIGAFLALAVRARRYLKREIETVVEGIDSIKQEVKPDGGHSLADEVRNLDRRLDRLEVAIRALNKDRFR